MSIAIVTGSAGLVGSEACRCFAARGLDVVGIDNDMRRRFFGPEASTRWQRDRLRDDLGDAYTHASVDIRSPEEVASVFETYGREISVVIHAAAQPSHDWAKRDPPTDFGVNAVGTLNLLEATRLHAPDAVFIFTSTNKVYGDTPNRLPLEERETRYEIPDGHAYAEGINETMSIDGSLHSLFGASKVAADVLVQEYGRTFDLRSACVRGGCLTGPNHSGTTLHGFLSYLMRCVALGEPYRVFGYKGKQVRDNLHSSDLVAAFAAFYDKPRFAEVYNIGGGRDSNCSMLEAIALCEEISGRDLDWSYADSNRLGDHQWWISDTSRFREHYPDWRVTRDVRSILRETYEANLERWRQPTA